MDVGGKGGDQDLALGLGDNIVERPGQAALRGVRARTLDIGRVGQQEQDAAFPPFGQTRQVGLPVVNRRMINLEIAGVDDRAQGSRNGQGRGVHNAVGDRDALDVKRPDLPLLAGTKLVDGRLLKQTPFGQLVANQAQGERRAIDRHVKLLEQIRQGADMVLVAVGEDDRLEVVVLVQIAEIRDHHVNAEHLLLGKHQAAVHGNRGRTTALGRAVFDQHEVEADLAQAAEGNDT